VKNADLILTNLFADHFREIPAQLQKNIAQLY
jgi:hypothetical protein